MTLEPRRIRLLALLGPIIVAALALLAWSQPWVTVELSDGVIVTAAGDAAAPALPPFALASLALVGALTLAGPVFRVVLGVLQSLLGAGLIVSGALVLADPVGAAAASLTAATGIDGLSSLREVIAVTTVSGWPWLAVIAGGVAVVLGVAIAATASRWPQRTRRYDAVRLAPGSTDPRTDRLDAWDALSDGDDPTAR